MISWLLNKWAKFNQKKSVVVDSKRGTKRVRGKFVWNPLLKYPENIACWCGSKKKAKVCCLPTVPETCSYKQAVINKKYLVYIKKHYGLT